MKAVPPISPATANTPMRCSTGALSTGMVQAPAESPGHLQGEALVDGSDRVWLPYDLAHLRTPNAGWTRLSARREVHHAGRLPYGWRAPAEGTLHILNGMGVTLGDSIIGMNALAWLKARHPALRIHLYRTPHAPAFVERLYQLVSCVFRPNVTAHFGIVTGHSGHRDRPRISGHRDRPFRDRDRPFRRS